MGCGKSREYEVRLPPAEESGGGIAAIFSQCPLLVVTLSPDSLCLLGRTWKFLSTNLPLPHVVHLDLGKSPFKMVLGACGEGAVLICHIYAQTLLVYIFFLFAISLCSIYFHMSIYVKGNMP